MKYPTQEQILYFNKHGVYLWDETFLREEIDVVGFESVYDKYHTVTTDFIREFVDWWNWDYLSRNEALTEEQIEEFKDKVNWKYIRTHYYKKLSDKFKEKWKDKLR